MKALRKKCVNEAIEVGNDHVVPDSWEEWQKNITKPKKSWKFALDFESLQYVFNPARRKEETAKVFFGVGGRHSEGKRESLSYSIKETGNNRTK